MGSETGYEVTVLLFLLAFCGYLSSSKWGSSASNVICIYILRVVSFENLMGMVHITWWENA
jgi:hypothetical protein